MLEKSGLFWFCALAGSGLFIIQFALVLIGIHDHDLDDGSAYDFKWLSKQAITGFLMMFGWIGLACQKEFELSLFTSSSIASVFGVLTILITGLIFRLAQKLRSTGTVFRIEEAIGKEAAVYHRIPKEGVGKISVSLRDFTHEIDAISLNGEEISSFTQVQIVKKADERTVVVVATK